ncbi:MAG: hypothetical protein F7C09_03910 [Aeropyrum sp.]|nr:hypothetical protein [Aeropyrum sp.]
MGVLSGLCRALIVSPPTLDLIEGPWGSESRPGGPGIYAGVAFQRAGCAVDLVGAIGHLTMETVVVEKRLGFNRVGYYESFDGYVFHHIYKAGGRVSRLVTEPRPLDIIRLLDLLRDADYNIILYSPIYGEDSGYIPQYLSSNWRGVVALDIQGYARRWKDGWAPPSKRIASIIHVSSDDSFYPSECSSYITIYTEGVRGGYVDICGGPRLGIPPPRKRLENPTGAGDVFTALVLVMLAIGGYSLKESLDRAVDLTAEVLKSANEVLSSYAGSTTSYNL